MMVTQAQVPCINIRLLLKSCWKAIRPKCITSINTLDQLVNTNAHCKGSVFDVNHLVNSSEANAYSYGWNELDEDLKHHWSKYSADTSQAHLALWNFLSNG